MATTDRSELKSRDKYITCVKHPGIDLLIWNYNHPCQYDRAWDEYTMQARGLITDSKGTIMARPFRKFFNVGEREDTQAYKLPDTFLEVREKIDGVLGIQYYNGNQVCIATRGTFTSPWALWATQWMGNFSKKDFLEGYTYLYEIIYPEGRILIDYGDKSECVLLAIINTETGQELTIDEESKRLGLSVAKKLPYNNLYEVVFDAKSLPMSQEGFVVRYPDNLRVKVKGDDYTRTQVAVMHCSTTAIWDILKAGGSINMLLQYLPDEVYLWVQEKEEALKSSYRELQREIAGWTIATKLQESRKKQAEFLLNRIDKSKASLVFMALDGKDIQAKMWDMIKPEFERPSVKGDNIG